MQALTNLIRWNWSKIDSFYMGRSRAHISVVDITDRLQRKILRTCMTEPIASTVSAWRKAERVFKVIFSRWLCSSMTAGWWQRSETCSRRNQTCRMLIRTSPGVRTKCQPDKMPTRHNANQRLAFCPDLSLWLAFCPSQLFGWHFVRTISTCFGILSESWKSQFMK